MTNEWASGDPAAMRNWALGLAPGDRRDIALGAALRLQPDAPDPTLLAAFSNERTRQAALTAPIFMTARTDPAAAHRMVDRYLSDPEIRAQAERMIDAAEHGALTGPAVAFDTNGAAMPRLVVPATAGTAPQIMFRQQSTPVR